MTRVLSNPTPLMLSTQKGAQAEKEEGPDTRHLASSFLRTKHRNHAEKKKRKCKGKEREERE